MSDPKREQDNAQEVQEVTKQKAKSVYDNIPEEIAQQIKQAASNLSGIPPEELPLEKSIEILGNSNPDPEIDAELDRIIEAQIGPMFDVMSDEQLEGINYAAQTGVLGNALSLTAEMLLQKIQEAQDVNNSKHITLDPPTEDPAAKKILLDTDTPPDKTITLPPEGMQESKIDISEIQAEISARGPAKEVTLERPQSAEEQEVSAMLADHLEGLTREVAAAFSESFSKEAIHMQFAKGYDTFPTASAAVKAALQSISDLINSPTFKAIKENVRTISEFTTKYRDEISKMAGTMEDLQGLAPFLTIEIKELKKDPKYADITLSDLLKHEGDEDNNVFLQLVERAQKRKAEYEAAEGAIEAVEQIAKDLPRIIATQTDSLDYPLDKPNSIIWSLLEDAPPDGQLKIDINTGRKGGKKALVMYTINFAALEDNKVRISKQLTSFDKRVYVAAAALYNGGNHIFSVTQIYRMMGNTGSPTSKQIQKINDSLTKMGSARVYLDSTGEVNINKGYPAFKYDAPLLPFERVTAYINNTLTDSAIHLFREPPLVTFAKERGQITTIPRPLLESPINKTEANLRLEDYLLERIGHMKNPKSKAPRKMLYSTIYARCGITSKKQKQREPEKIKRYLEHYKSKKWIKGYKEDKDGITIIL